MCNVKVRTNIHFKQEVTGLNFMMGHNHVFIYKMLAHLSVVHAFIQFSISEFTHH